MSHTGFTYWLENSSDYSNVSTMSSQREVKVLQEQLRGVQQQLANLHSQVRCLTEICSPQSLTPTSRRLTTGTGRDLDVPTYLNYEPEDERSDSENDYENIPKIQHNLTFTIQRTVSDILMCSMSPQPPAASDQSDLNSFNLSQTLDSHPSVNIRDLSRIPVVGDNHMDYSITDIVNALHPSPDLCPPQNTPESTFNGYMEISDIRPCARRLFPESSTKVGADLFVGRNPEVRSTSVPKVPKVPKGRRSLSITAEKSAFPRDSKSTDAKQLLRSSTRRSLKLSKRTIKKQDEKAPVPAPSMQNVTARRKRRSERPPVIGNDYKGPTSGQKRKHRDSTYQSLLRLHMEEEPESAKIYESIKDTCPHNMTMSSDTTEFAEAPLSTKQPVTKKEAKKPSKRRSISNELRRFGKNIQKFGAKKLKLETLAVL